MSPTSTMVTKAACSVIPILFQSLSSSINWSKRNLSTVTTDSPGARIIRYFEEHPSIQERSQFMIKQLTKRLSPEENDAFQIQLHTDKIDQYSDRHLMRVLAACARGTFRSAPRTKWEAFPMRDIESIPGIGHKYSTSSFIEILNYLPDLILELQGTEPIKILELGGFGFNDSFLLIRDLEKKGILIDSFIGVDINQQGTIAASTFNEHVAKIKSHQIINKDVFRYIKEDAIKGLSENCVVAIRFLAVFQPDQINSFFHDMNTSLKIGDVFVFNYSLFGNEAKRVGSKTASGYRLEERSGAQMLFLRDDHMQTFLTKDFIKKLLVKNGLEMIVEKEEEILGGNGTDIIRGQHDCYPRITVFAIKK
jgi:hypothetical protein